MANDEVLLRIESKLDQVLRLIALQTTGSLKQAPAIQLLAAAGFERKVIAELLHTTPNTVSVTLSTSKAKTKPHKGARKDK
jgi:DNA-binding NarL/FixJ family response regulator